MTINCNANLIIKLTNLQSNLSKRLEGQLSFHGISFSEFLVMHHLNSSPNEALRRIDLAERVGLSASGITRLLLPMEKIGLVQKMANERDARVSLVKLTKAGKQLYEDAEISVNQSANSLTKALTDKQRSNFIGLIDTML